MRRNQTLSQRAQMSVTQPRSRVSDGSSQRSARGWRPGSPPGSRRRSRAPNLWRGGFAAPRGGQGQVPGRVDPCARAPDHSSMPDRVFTPEEANAALPELRPLVEAMVAAKRALDEAQELRVDFARRIAGNGGGIPPAELAAMDSTVETAAAELASAIGKVQATGVLVKDLDAGLVDFPAKRGGE